MSGTVSPNQLPPDRRVDHDADDYLEAATPLSDPEAGEFVDVSPDPDEIVLEDAPDGGVYATDPDADTLTEYTSGPDSAFYSNLAEYIPQSVQDAIVSDLLDKIENDKESRKKRDEQYTEGLRRSGLGNDAPGGAEFEGASRVVHPMISEACIDYESRIIKELWPISGPVKPKILGVVTPEKAERAQRVTEHMNFQLTTLMKEARSVVETTLTQVPLGGSQFIHLWHDHQLRRPRCEFRAIDNIYLPFGAADYLSAQRKTYADNITEMEYKKRVQQGMYVDLDIGPASQLPEESKAQKANDKIEGVEDTGQNVDNERLIYETITYLEISPELHDAIQNCACVEEIGQFLPYLITIDVTTRKMLSMYRNWEEGDDTFEPIQYDFEIPFIPWRSAFSIGFPQIIGGLSAAATGALRALMDSAHANNAFGGLILKGSGAGGQTVRTQIGEFAEIDTGLETKDIRQVVMPFAPTQPSGVLFQLLGFVVDAARGVVRTSLDENPSNTPVPVGTQMSRVEESLVVFSAIHGRAHAAFNRFLAGLHRLNRLYLPEIVKVDIEGKELLVRRKDYDGPCVVQGVSDPTIYSDQQRFAQLNYIQQRVMAMPQLWKLREVELAGLRLMKWPNPEGLLQDQPEPHELNPTNESLSMSLGQPVLVFPDQDHLAHLQVHLDYTKSPLFGANPLIAPKYLPAALNHIAQHLAYLYVSQTVETVKNAAGGVDPVQMMSKDIDVKKKFDQLLATASPQVIASLEAQLQGIAPILQQAQQMMQQFMPKPPMDPAQAAVMAATQETQRKAAADQTDAQITSSKDQADAQAKQRANAIAADHVAAMREGQQLQAQVKLQTTAVDADTALEIASKRNTSYTNGQSLTK